jgi:hypothetical protein
MQDTPNTRRSILATYINDMLALEGNIAQAIERQHADHRVAHHPDVQRLLRSVISGSVARRDTLAQNAGEMVSDVVATIKDAIASAAGTLAGFYDQVREHALSKMLRDDVTALTMAATSYGMLYTTALAFEDNTIAETALRHLNELPPQIMEIASLIPGVVVEELAKDDPRVNMESAGFAAEAIDQAWITGELAMPV